VIAIAVDTYHRALTPLQAVCYRPPAHL